jgi:hypothetical protein
MPQLPRIKDLPNSTREACRIVDIFSAALALATTSSPQACLEAADYIERGNFDPDPEPTLTTIATYVRYLRVRANCASQKEVSFHVFRS